MNIVGGEAIWGRVEKKYESLLEPDHEEELLERLESFLNDAPSRSRPMRA